MKDRNVRGLHTHRFTDNPEEQRFADWWASHGPRILPYLLTPSSQDQHFPNVPTAREEQVAATVIQWLGSPVGQGFLRDMGYEKKGQ